MRKAIAFVLITIVAAYAYAVGLMPCPDCEQPVSPRAVFCPHCGCPADAIKDAAALLAEPAESAPRLPIVRFATESSSGSAVAYAEGGRCFIVMDAMQLADATSLDLVPVTTNSPVAYLKLQLAPHAPLVRFQTHATNLLFLALGSHRASATKGAFCLMPDGAVVAVKPEQLPPDDILAFVDAQTNLLNMVCRAGMAATAVPLPQDRDWIDVAPGAFREQMSRLAGAEKEASQSSLSAEAKRALGETKWLSPFLEKRARRIVDSPKEDRKP